MEIKEINTNRVRKLAEQTEYLVWQGCGGSLEEWAEGIQKTMIDEKVADKNYKLKELYVFTNKNGLTCLLQPLDNLSISKLAIVRLQLRSIFGTMWLSDFIDNGYLD